MKQHVTDRIGNNYLSWKGGQKILISTPTGSGKTTFVINVLLKHAIQQKKHMVYICNRQVLNDQITVQADDKIRAMFEVGDGISAEAARQHLHIYTYQSLEKAQIFPSVWIKDTAEQKNRILYNTDILYYIFDEAHYMVSDAAFNSDTNYWTAFNIQNPFSTNIRIYLTATPEPLLAFLHSNDILRDKIQRSVYESFSENRKLFRDNGEVIQKQVSMILADFADACKKAELSLKIPSEKRIIQKLKDSDDSMFYAFYSKIDQAFQNTEKRLDHVYSGTPDYSYITPVYFKKYEELIDEINRTSDQKWLIFIDSEATGKVFKKQLEDSGEENVGYLSREEIRTNLHAQEIYHTIVTTEHFPCRILITTPVLDCGINIHDSKVTNIVITCDNKTGFLQMLGRRRVDEGEKIRLFIKAYSYQSIRMRHRQCKNEIQTLNILSLKNSTVSIWDRKQKNTIDGSYLSKSMLKSLYNSFNSIAPYLWYKEDTKIELHPVDEHRALNRQIKVNSIDLVLYGIQYSKTGYLYRLLQVREYEKAIKDNCFFKDVFCNFMDYVSSCIQIMNSNKYLVPFWPELFKANNNLQLNRHTISRNRDNLIAQYKSEKIKTVDSRHTVNKHFFLDQQLAWIGKEYNEGCWYYGPLQALIDYLEDHVNGQPLDIDAFSKELFDLIKELPKLPHTIKKDISRYKDREKPPGKNKLEKSLRELNLHYEIISQQKSINGERKTFWYLKGKPSPNLQTKPPSMLL